MPKRSRPRPAAANKPKTRARITPRLSLVTISIPVYNEAENIAELLKRLRGIADAHSQRYAFEFLFTDDGSVDSTYDLLMHEARLDHRIRVLKLSRNFGFQQNILTNFLHARGNAAIEIDADLQDPPELIGEFLALWEKGYKVVYGVRTTRNEGAVIQYLRKLAYRLINSLSEVKVPTDAGDFRLIDRLIIEHLRSLTDRNPYLRGYISGLGYPQIGVPYERPQRSAGVSKFTLLKLITLGVDGITSQSTRPLHYITLFGFALSLIVVLMTVFYGLSWLLGFENETRGFPTLVLLQLFAIGMNAVFLGIMGEYIGRIFNNVRGHPVAIVEKIIECGVEMKSPDSTSARDAGENSRPETH